eukprot:Selendium_serpulae@DN5577_c0_g1_i1.p1
MGNSVPRCNSLPSPFAGCFPGKQGKKYCVGVAEQAIVRVVPYWEGGKKVCGAVKVRRRAVLRTALPTDCVNVGGDAEFPFRYGGDKAEQLGLDKAYSFARPAEEQLDLVIDEDGKSVYEAPEDLEQKVDEDGPIEEEVPHAEFELGEETFSTHVIKVDHFDAATLGDPLANIRVADVPASGFVNRNVEEAPHCIDVGGTLTMAHLMGRHANADTAEPRRMTCPLPLFSYVAMSPVKLDLESGPVVHRGQHGRPGAYLTDLPSPPPTPWSPKAAAESPGWTVWSGQERFDSLSEGSQ